MEKNTPNAESFERKNSRERSRNRVSIKKKGSSIHTEDSRSVPLAVSLNQLGSSHLGQLDPNAPFPSEIKQEEEDERDEPEAKKQRCASALSRGKEKAPSKKIYKRKKAVKDVDELAGSDSAVQFPLRHDLQLMMHGLGDCQRPLSSTLDQVETVLKQQMELLLQSAAEVGGRSNGNEMQPQQFLYLLARDKVKLHRLLRYLCLKDSRAQLMNDSKEKNPDTLKAAPNEEDELEVGCQEGGKKGPRRQICYDFLRQLDQTGELLSQLNQGPTEDEVKKQREERLERQTRFMDTKCYLEFSEARTASFGGKGQVGAFRKWLERLRPGFTFHSVTMEILSYLAFETVAQLVDLALLVRNERSNWNEVCSSKIGKQKTNQDTSELLSIRAIQPNEIQEALRRFHKPNGAMAAFARSYTTPLRRKILCL